MLRTWKDKDGILCIWRLGGLISLAACCKECVKESLDAGNVHYTDMAGDPDLRLAIAENTQRKMVFPSILIKMSSYSWGYGSNACCL